MRLASGLTAAFATLALTSCASSGIHAVTSGSTVAVSGLAFDVPTGWTTAHKTAFCETPAEHSVDVVTDVTVEFPVPCPSGPSPGAREPTYIIVQPLDPHADVAGDKTTWHGHAALVATDTFGGVTTITLSVRSEHAQVIVQSPDAAEARDLLTHAHPAKG